MLRNVYKKSKIMSKLLSKYSEICMEYLKKNQKYIYIHFINNICLFSYYYTRSNNLNKYILFMYT